MAPRQETIIVRRARAGKQHGAHGGAWKVAFADFTLAMMALFLVLWIMQVADQKERETVVKYLNGELYPSGDINPFDLRNIPSLIDLQGQPSVQQPVVPTPPVVMKCVALRCAPMYQKASGSPMPVWDPN